MVFLFSIQSCFPYRNLVSCAFQLEENFTQGISFNKGIESLAKLLAILFKHLEIYIYITQHDQTWSKASKYLYMSLLCFTIQPLISDHINNILSNRENLYILLSITNNIFKSLPYSNHFSSHSFFDVLHCL